MGNTPGQDEDLTYQVMPQAGGKFASTEPARPNVKPEPIKPIAQQPPAQQPIPPQQAAAPKPAAPAPELPIEPESPFKSRLTYIIIGVIVLAVVGALAYFMLWSKQEQTPEATQQLPKTWLLRYFNKETCDDVSVCGDTADPDKDGLTNFEEFKKSNTSLTNPDSDGDGLADGDEYNIYKTDPTDKFTDTRQNVEANNYTDGHQIKNGYDPLNPGQKIAAIEARAKQIQADTEKFGLHEPTVTTLKTATPATETVQPKTVTIMIENGKFDPTTTSINKNDSVVWLNKDSKTHQVASDPHPTHTGLAGLASAVLETNQTFSFKFEQTGTFGYHDHLNPIIKGSVEVK